MTRTGGADVAGTFEARTVELGQRVGYGPLVGTIRRSQVYAKYQHERPDLVHPTGGQWKYQEAALYALHKAALARVAASVLAPTGPTGGMDDAMKLIEGMAYALTPKESGALAGSAHLQVRDGGRVVRNHPPEVPRLTEAQLRARRGGRHRKGGRRGR